MGRCPNTPRFFEKNRVKLLSKRNYIAFFGKKYIELFQKYHGSAMVFYKSLGQAFSKACGVLGQCPKVLDKFIFIELIKTMDSVHTLQTFEKVWAKRNGLNLIFSKWKSGFCRNFFIEKVPCTFKNLFKTAHSMCLRK